MMFDHVTVCLSIYRRQNEDKRSLLIIDQENDYLKHFGRFFPLSLHRIAEKRLFRSRAYVLIEIPALILILDPI